MHHDWPFLPVVTRSPERQPTQHLVWATNLNQLWKVHSFRAFSYGLDITNGCGWQYFHLRHEFFGWRGWRSRLPITQKRRLARAGRLDPHLALWDKPEQRSFRNRDRVPVLKTVSCLSHPNRKNWNGDRYRIHRNAKTEILGSDRPVHCFSPMRYSVVRASATVRQRRIPTHRSALRFEEKSTTS